nr:type I polyketide synthase [Kibdelosporangium sp. MJ126-NF4]CEL18440.1 Malonyl CoA-acyl carrier protein transacylase [Kibdelosporangium sp. MJ126-NF4]CTQ97923.1 Malonyl CoA-acyl carrier protein transacylase (EC 2.3.1.39) [Kibdelosporangium sp. MJ126-NF4]
MSHLSVQEARREPVAIIGAGCRLPGAATVDAFWEILSTGTDTVAPMSDERRALDVRKSATDSAHRQPADREGGFLDGIDAFDANFFEMSPYEAVRLDPQQRLLLETVWEAVEDAGLTTEQLAGTRTGAYTCCFVSHYWDVLTAAGMTDMHALLGASRYSVAAGRIAHLLDLRGPALGTEATCASSLAAVHLATQAIQSGEIDMAIVGGVNLLLCRELDMGAAEAGLLSPTGRCRFGDESADGFVRAEGAVTVVLKSVSQAVRDGDRIYATILGSSMSSNGRQGQSLTDTGTVGQEEMLRTAYRAAGADPAHLDYVEAHGPGTTEGDTAELGALSRFLRAEFERIGRPLDQRCVVGSAKSNIGHVEVAAGLAGLLKTALALHRRTIPATLHVRTPHRVLGEEGCPVELALDSRPWPDRGRPALAGVTALGTYGMNAHVVLSEAPPRATETVPVRDDERALILPLSARDPKALRELASAYADTMDKAENPADVCFSAGARRSQLNLRLAVSGSNPTALAEQLRDFGSGGRATFPIGRDNRLEGRPRIVFVFPGQGSQWTGMGRELMAANPVFAERMAECDLAVYQELGWSVIDRLRSDEPMTTLDVIQPSLWAVQVCLAAVWRDWGVEPDLVIGHSMGEYAAAATAGALSVRDAAAVACRRSTLMAEFPGEGAMWAVQLDEAEALAAIGGHTDVVSVGAVNSDHSTMLSGDADTLLRIVEPLQRRGVFCRQVRARFASHSPHVEPLLPDVVAALGDIRPTAGRIPIHSTALDRRVDGSGFDADYWATNLRNPVRFAPAVHSALADSPHTIFIEISAHPVLTVCIEDVIESVGVDAVALPSLHRDSPETSSLHASLGTAYTRGHDPDWHRVNGDGRYVPLPSYPWQRRRYWADPAQQEQTATAADTAMPVRNTIRTVDSLTRDMRLQVAAVLSMSPDLIDPTVPLSFSGMDSLLAAKLRARMKQELDLHIPIRDFLSSRSLNDLASQAHRAGSGQDS